MSYPSSPNNSTQGVFDKLWWAIPLLLMGVLAISGQSFWIDECMTAIFVSQPTLADWWHDMGTTTDYPESQMPLYIFYLWCWDKVFGHGEVSLRLAALPWFVPGVAAFLYSLRKVGNRGVGVILVTCSSAFLWYYLDEARPYAMQVGISCFIFASLAECQSSSETVGHRWFLAFLIGLLLLSASSLVGMVWISAAIVACGMFPVATMKEWVRRHRKFIGIIAAVLACLGAYYSWTVLRGVKATKIGTTTWQSIMFIFYEQLGFGGLGPGRAQLREQGARALVSYWPWLCLYAVAVGTVLLAGLRVVWGSFARRSLLWITAGLGVPVTFFLAAGMLAHFRVLGRHLAPLMPVWFFILSLGAVFLWRRGGPGRVAVMIFLGLSLTSALQIRWASRHMKDDYRSAVAFSKAALAEGRSVWWNASKEAAKHYDLRLTDDPNEPEKALLLFNPTGSSLAQLRPPDFVVVSKPDIFDSRQAVASWLKQSGYQPQTNFPVFTIWGPGQPP